VCAIPHLDLLEHIQDLGVKTPSGHIQFMNRVLCSAPGTRTTFDIIKHTSFIREKYRDKNSEGPSGFTVRAPLRLQVAGPNFRNPPTCGAIAFSIIDSYSLQSMMTRGKGVLATLSRGCDLWGRVRCQASATLCEHPCEIDMATPRCQMQRSRPILLLG
jgi:hypothetical protein